MANFVTCNQLNAALGVYQAQLRDCTGAALAANTQVATCQDLDDAIATIPTDVFLGAIGHGYDEATNTLHLELNDGSIVDVDLTALINDATAGMQPVLRNCAGVPLPANAQVATCADLTALSGTTTAALAGKQDALRNCAGAPLAGNTQVATCADLTAVEAGVATDLAGKQDALRNCAGAPLAANAQVATCADLPSQATLTQVIDGAAGPQYVNSAVANQRMALPIMGVGALENRPDPLSTLAVAIGNDALKSHEGPSIYSVAVGRRALENLNPAPGLAGIGADVAVGGDAGANFNPTQSNYGGMTFVGSQAGLAVVDGAQSTLIGGAGVNYTSPMTAVESVAVGHYALNIGRLGQAVTVRNAVAIGSDAGSRRAGSASTDRRNGNTAVGAGAGALGFGEMPLSHSVTTIGAHAGTDAWGQNIVAVGNEALHKGLGFNTTAVGARAGLNNVSAHATFLGYNTREAHAPTLFGNVATTVGLAEDVQSSYVDVPAGGLPSSGNPVTLQFFATPVCTPGTEIGGTFHGVVQADGLRVRISSGNPNLLAPPYDAALVQGVSVELRAHSDNSTALGANAIISAPNTVYLGDAGVTAVRSQGAFYAAGTLLTSDQRLKRDIADVDMAAATAFVKGLRFVGYVKVANYFAKRNQLEQHVQFAQAANDTAALAAANAALAAYTVTSPVGQDGRQEYGLIAQEVQTLAAQHGFDAVVQADADGTLSLDYNSIQSIINAVVLASISI